MLVNGDSLMKLQENGHQCYDGLSCSQLLQIFEPLITNKFSPAHSVVIGR